MWFVGLGTPGLQKTIGQQKHFRIPLVYVLLSLASEFSVPPKSFVGFHDSKAMGFPDDPGPV